MARQPALKNKRGMTLVEVMIAMVLSLVIFLALMQTSLISINQNVRNNLRDEAGRIAEERMSALKNLPFDDGALAEIADAADAITSRRIRNFDIAFTSRKKIDAVGTDIKELTITVSWAWKGQTFTNSVTTVLKRP